MKLKTAVGLLALCLLGGCSAGAKTQAVQTALENDETRRESFEATLRVLDQHPEYVDELFALTLQHRPTLDRFLWNAAQHLDEDWLARMNARHLVDNPAAAHQVMIAVLDDVSDEAETLAALSRAMEQRAQIAAMVVAARPETVRANLRALFGRDPEEPRGSPRVLGRVAAQRRGDGPAPGGQPGDDSGARQGVRQRRHQRSRAEQRRLRRPTLRVGLSRAAAPAKGGTGARALQPRGHRRFT